MFATSAHRVRALCLVSALACLAGATRFAGAQDGAARPGDRVLLRILRDSIVSDSLRIDPRGYTVLPLAGDVRLGGLAGGAIQDTVRARLAPFVKPQFVEATLLRRVRVVGDLNKPGVYYLDRTATIRDAVAVASGVAEIGHDKSASLVRNGTVTRFADWRTDPRTDDPIDSGDEIVVERLGWITRNAISVVTGAGVLASIIVTISRR